MGGGEKVGGSVGSVGCGLVGVGYGRVCRCCGGQSAVVVKQVVGHEACEHDLETRETVNLVTNGKTCRAKPTVTTQLQIYVCPHNFP